MRRPWGVSRCSTRLAFVEVFSDERAITRVEFIERALEWFAEHGVWVQRVTSDTGASYSSRAFAATCAHHRVRHRGARPFSPAPTAKPNASSKPRRRNGPTRPHQSTA
jgi:hypothetical protein